MNSRLASLKPYPFQRLGELIQSVSPPAGKSAIKLTMGEPQHAAPTFVLEEITRNLGDLSNYPLTKGNAALLRSSWRSWGSLK